MKWISCFTVKRCSLKTYFFVYLGISIHFGEAYPLVAVIIVLTVCDATDPHPLVFASGYSLRDTAFLDTCTERVSAVLAALPLQYGVAGGEVIRDTLTAWLVSITLTALLVMLYPLPGAQKFYSRAGETGLQKHRYINHGTASVLSFAII
jgi:hypothetical protein